MMIKRLLLGSAISAASLVMAGNASALPTTVNEWSFSTNATFSDAIFNGTAGTQIESDYELSWGRNPNATTNPGDFENPNSNADYNRSALTIGKTNGPNTGGGPSTGTVFTNFDGSPDPGAGEVGDGISFTHWNNPLDGGFSTLTSATITDTLTLTPIDPVTQDDGTAWSGDAAAPTIIFEFQFRETPNSPSSGICAGGEASTGGCGDLFGFLGSTPTLNLPVPYAGVNYFANILVFGPGGSISPIGTLSEGECSALGFVVDGVVQECQGFLTAEAQATTVNFAFDISTERFVDVPVPTTLALFGLGLLGLGFSGKRRNA